MSTCSRAARAVLGALLAALVGCVLTLLSAAPAGATPAPTPSMPPPISILPGLLPPLSLPTITLPSTVPLLNGVASTVNGLSGTLQKTVDGVLNPASPASAPRAPAAPTAHPTRPTRTAPSAPRRMSRPASGTVRAAAPTHAAATRTRPARLFTANGPARAGKARTGVLGAPARVSDPARFVQRAADAVLHPSRALLTLVAITAICALGMLALIARLGRRTW